MYIYIYIQLNGFINQGHPWCLCWLPDRTGCELEETVHGLGIVGHDEAELLVQCQFLRMIAPHSCCWSKHTVFFFELSGQANLVGE